MVDKIKQAVIGNGKKVATGSISVAALLGLIWTIFIGPVNSEVKDLDKAMHFNREKNIQQDGELKTQAVVLKRIDDNVKTLLSKIR